MKILKKTQVLIFISVFIAIEIILTRYFSFQTDRLRISFGFIPVSLAAMLFGPIIGGITGMLGDILGMMIFPKGPYFPGFTLSALLVGMVYGIFLYRKPKTLWRIWLTVLIIISFISLGLNTLWLSMILHIPYPMLFIQRMLTSVANLLIQIIMIPIVWKRIGLLLETRYIQKLR